jgi:glycosyltransferase involved in cell wall biosynthesis
MNPPAVLHLLSLHGGGVDRHVRDVAAAVPREHLIWYVDRDAEVLEAARDPRFLPLDPARVEARPHDLAHWLGANGVGLAHVHNLGREIRRRAEQVAEALRIPVLATLHDVQFLRRDAFLFADPQADPAWIAELDPFLRRAAAVFAPSDYIAARARSEFPGVEITVVPNGLAPPGGVGEAKARAAWLEAPRPQRIVALLGAIGPHKGADVLRELPAHLQGSGIGVVVIGYLDRQLQPGWNGETGVFVHGPYEPADTAALLRAYGVELVVFPNHAPESFSYTLSEAWAAGYPVLASARGAIGERVRRHGGGWLLEEPFGAAEVARELVRLLSPGAAEELARVKSLLSHPDPQRVPTLEAMADMFDAFYRRYGRDTGPAGAADPQAIQSLLATSLDSSLFRKELAYLATLCEESNRLRKFEVEARDWIAHLEGDVEALRADIRSVVSQRDALAAEAEELRAIHAFFLGLPEPLRRLVIRLGRRARN